MDTRVTLLSITRREQIAVPPRGYFDDPDAHVDNCARNAIGSSWIFLAKSPRVYANIFGAEVRAPVTTHEAANFFWTVLASERGD